MLIVNTMAQNYNELEYLTRYVKAFEKNTRKDISENGVSHREASPIIMERLYKMYNSLNLDMDDQTARKVFDNVHPGFINYVKKLEKKQTSFFKNIFVGSSNIDNTRTANYNSYRRVDMER